MTGVVWTYRARGRLQEVYRKIAEDQPSNAKHFIERLIERGDSLAEQSFRGRMVPEYENPTIREVFEGEYRIIYQTQESMIAILTIRGFAELLPSDPEKL
ncbi:type II toxin-antitoxin system RelE/ParE family toxin [Alkalimarinus coralli]|uniref:type II toxin-antitoxin system RelE/ParE family toxin n=1 Tax=Alkalimarinus coralli TaxID=2935863 RepID=UPI00202B5FCF|nr:type II toxin-antitoxin system RelE/ParE family toxin [Alkalimarinus coralli]